LGGEAGKGGGKTKGILSVAEGTYTEKRRPAYAKNRRMQQPILSFTGSGG